ncbi:hypothetical protein B7494_g7612 [Chlorociboria aeruginascens]|nr:hypothetical protein B7494_g7612 [Chlorociboria aeruginascens]
MFIALITAPALLAVQEVVRQGQAKDRREEHRARRSNLVASCAMPSPYAREIDHGQVVLSNSRLYINGVSSTASAHPFAGYFLPYPDSTYEGLVSSITDVEPIMNWIYVDRETYQVKYGVRADSQLNITGPFDCTRQDRRLTIEGWEGFVAVREEAVEGKAIWALYYDRDHDGLKGKLGGGRIVLDVELWRWEKRTVTTGVVNNFLLPVIEHVDPLPQLTDFASSPAERNGTSTEVAQQLHSNSNGKPIMPNMDNAQRVLVFAFGAFDRYYVCWQDKAQQYFQESHNLPNPLQQWLFLKDGQTRDFPTLQVSLGSHDEFFASDKFGKISSRDLAAQGRDIDAVPSDGENPALKRIRTRTLSSITRLEALTKKPNVSDMPKLRRRTTVGDPIWPWLIDKRQSWDETQLILPEPQKPEQNTSIQRSYTLGVEKAFPARSSYVDVGVQTDTKHEECSHFFRIRSERISPIFLDSVGRVSIGGMQDVCRDQCYRLGDALQTWIYIEILHCWTAREY